MTTRAQPGSQGQVPATVSEAEFKTPKASSWQRSRVRPPANESDCIQPPRPSAPPHQQPQHQADPPHQPPNLQFLPLHPSVETSPHFCTPPISSHRPLDGSRGAGVEYNQNSGAGVEFNRNSGAGVEYNRNSGAAVEYIRNDVARVEYNRNGGAGVEYNRSNAVGPPVYTLPLTDTDKLERSRYSRSDDTHGAATSHWVEPSATRREAFAKDQGTVMNQGRDWIGPGEVARVSGNEGRYLGLNATSAVNHHFIHGHGSNAGNDSLRSRSLGGGQTGLGGEGDYAPNHLDLVHWQQQQLRQQHAGLGRVGLGVDRNTGARLVERGPMAYDYRLQPAPRLEETRALERLQFFADDIILQKDRIIDEQRTRILDLESGLPFNHSTLVNHRAPSSVAPLTRRLVYRDADSTRDPVQQPLDAERLQAQLGAVEYELSELQVSSISKLQAKDEELKALKAQIADKDKVISDWTSRFTELTNKHQDLTREIEAQTKYMQDLPTADEHRATLKTITELTAGNAEKAACVERADRKLLELKRHLESRDSLIDALEAGQSELKVKLLQTEKLTADLEEKVATRPDLGENQRLIGDIKRLETALDNAEKIIRLERRGWADKQAGYEEALRLVRGSLVDERACITALRAELVSKDLTLKGAKQTIKELSSERDDWTEKCRSLEAEVRRLGAAAPPVLNAQTLASLVSELGACCSQLHSLGSVCMELAEGEEPNISALLGLRGVDEAGTAVNSDLATTNEVLSARLSQVRALSRDVDRLRDRLSTKVAEDMGRRMTCSQQ